MNAGVRIVCFVAVVLALALRQGISVPGDDMHLIVPLLAEDAPDFSNDPYFSNDTKNYAFMKSLLAVGVSQFTLAQVLVALSVISIAMMILGTTIMASSRSAGKVPSSLVGILIIATGFALFGNTLSSNSYHPQFTAYACVTLSLAAIFLGRFGLAGLMLIMAGMFHPLVGFYGIGFLFIGLIEKRPGLRQVIISSVFGLLTLIL